MRYAYASARRARAACKAAKRPRSEAKPSEAPAKDGRRAKAGPCTGWWLSVALAPLVANPAAAELFRCQGPDGRTIYTDQKDTCPGAKPFEPSGQVLSAPTPVGASAGSAQPAPAAPGTGPLAEEEATMAQHWQDKKRAVLEQIAQIQERREWLRKYINHCKWRDYVATRDDAGVEKVVNCSEMRREFAELDDKEAAARAYLNEGLPEECRKAGCLPGWVR